ncbi:hypothetical protein GCM10028825_49960 [Spirosoma agri]
MGSDWLTVEGFGWQRYVLSVIEQINAYYHVPSCGNCTEHLESSLQLGNLTGKGSIVSLVI